MKIQNSKLRDLNLALLEFLSIPTDFDIAYAGSRSIQKVESALKTFEMARTKICESLAGKDKDGNALIVDSVDEQGNKGKKYGFSTPEIEEEAKRKTKELGDMEVEVELYRLPIYKASKIKNISGSLIYRLGEFIDETQSEEPKIIKLN